MRLACLFDLFCPLLETVVCLFGGKEVVLIWWGNGTLVLGFLLCLGFFFYLTKAVKVLVTAIMTTKQFSLLEDEFFWIILDFS